LLGAMGEKSRTRRGDSSTPPRPRRPLGAGGRGIPGAPIPSAARPRGASGGGALLSPGTVAQSRAAGRPLPIWIWRTS
jgi:hypothetical protein